MTKTTHETGHAKNVDSLGLLISHVTSYGAKYNPSNAAIALKALQDLEIAGRKAVNDVSLALSTLEQAGAAREPLFKRLNPTTTSILNMLRASTSSGKIDANATTIVRKIRGSRAKALKPHDNPPAKPAVAVEGAVAAPKTKSVSQQSYDKQVDNFDELFALVSTVPEYKPNEETLKVEGLKTFATELRSKNVACKDAEVALENARTERNRILYAPNTGMVDVANAAKTYIKALFGAASPEFRQIAGISFHRNSF